MQAVCAGLAVLRVREEEERIGRDRGLHHLRGDIEAMPDEVKPLPPGPAFIPYPPHKWHFNEDAVAVQEPTVIRRVKSVPDGYIWQPATDHTMAGWVRPKGGALPT